MRNVRLSVVVAGAVSLGAVLAYAAWAQPPAPTTAPPAGGYGPSTPPAPYYQGGGHAGTVTYGALTVYPSNEWAAQEVQLERESQDLARQIARTESRDEKEKLRTKLADVLARQFEAQQKRRQAEIDAIEARLKTLREMMRKREDAKREIIQRRQEQLLQEAEGLGWSSPGTPGWPVPTASTPQVPPPAVGTTPRQ